MATVREELMKYLTQSQMSHFFIDKMGIISVNSYGAVGDGVTDDTVAVQLAIDAAIEANKKEVYFVGGKTYLINTLTNTSGITFIGDNVTITGTSGITTVSLSTYLADYAKYVAQPVYNVKGYGAKGDGVTDDTAAIQSVFNTVPASSVIFFPPGAYKISSTLTLSKNNITIIAEGLAYINYTGTGNVLEITNCEFVSIRGLRLICNANTGHGLYLSNALRVMLDNCSIYNAGQDCLYATNSWWLSTKDCVFDQPGTGYACVNQVAGMNNVAHIHSRFVARGQTGVLHQGGRAVSFVACDFSGTGGTGANISGSGDVLFDGCYFEALDTGIKWSHATNWIVGLTVIGCYFNLQNRNNAIGIDYVRGAYSTIINNHFLGNTPTYTSTGVQVGDYDINRFIEIQNNYFESITTPVVNPSNRAKYTPTREVYGTAPPIDGSWTQGSVVWNTSRTELGSAGSKYIIIGWTCVAGGTPGTWREMRVLTGN